MLEWVRKLTAKIHERNVNKDIEWAYNPLFTFGEKLVLEESKLERQLEMLQWLEKELQQDGDKPADKAVKDRWKAVKLVPIIEHYKTLLDQINELCDHMPEPPEKPQKYIIDYNLDGTI